MSHLQSYNRADNAVQVLDQAFPKVLSHRSSAENRLPSLTRICQPGEKVAARSDIHFKTWQAYWKCISKD